MIDASFDQEGVTLNLTPREYRLIDCATSWVLYGQPPEDFDARLSVTREDAEAFSHELSAAQRQAKAEGRMWTWL